MMAHLLCSNWMQPIYQELLHSSRYNAARTGERDRPSNGLASISAHPLRKFGYSEHCVYTGAVLSFIYIAYLVSGNSLSGAKVFGDAFSRIPTMGIFWKIGFGERKFSADWFSGREKFSGYEKHWKCFVVRGVSEGNLFWFLELRGFETVSNGFYHVPCLPVR